MPVSMLRYHGRASARSDTPGSLSLSWRPDCFTDLLGSSYTWLHLPARLGGCLVRLDSLSLSRHVRVLSFIHCAALFSYSFPLPHPSFFYPCAGYLSWPILSCLSLDLTTTVSLSSYFPSNAQHERPSIFPLLLFPRFYFSLCSRIPSSCVHPPALILRHSRLIMQDCVPVSTDCAQSCW